MSTLEEEIIDKFHQLDVSAQKRVLATLAGTLTGDFQQSFDYEAWWQEVDAVRGSLNLGEDAPSASDLINEAREERDRAITDSLHRSGRGSSAGDDSN